MRTAREGRGWLRLIGSKQYVGEGREGNAIREPDEEDNEAT